MNREERLRRQKDFLTGFAFWVVWLVILWVVLKAAGSVLFPFLAAFAVAALLAGAVKFITERTHIKEESWRLQRFFSFIYFWQPSFILQAVIW